ncbi:hypothetical protein JCM19992_12830 [Thermostilla marina]
MKCPKCWSDKAYLRSCPAWQRWVYALLLLRPMACRHCFHEFVTLWFFTWGKRVHPPRLRIVRDQISAPSQAELHLASRRNRPPRADAA